MKFTRTGGVPELRCVHTTVVYDNESGKIIHLHYTAILDGASVPSEEEMVKNALSRANHMYIDCSKASALHLMNVQLRPDTEYRIDMNTRSVVEVQTPKQGRGDLSRQA